MNSSSFARAVASSFDKPAASYCSGVIAFCTPGKAGVSGSAAGNQTSEARSRQKNEMNLFIGRGRPTHSFQAGMSKLIRRSLLQIIDLDHTNAVAVLPGEDRRE